MVIRIQTPFGLDGETSMPATGMTSLLLVPQYVRVG